ncbi:MAG: hypothetical protein Q9165_000469 [Trypethelium subeluteriae]
MAPSEGIARVLKVRRGSKEYNDLSRTSTANETSSLDRGGTRASIDRAIDKFKDNIRISSEESGPHRNSADSTKLSRLLSKTKRRRRKDDREAVRHDNRPSTVEGVPSSTEDQTWQDNPSQESLAQDHSGGSSLLTEDSDVEVPAPTRPSISPHHSHVGYLTLSSPLIASAQLSPVASTEATVGSTTTQSASRSLDILAPKHASTLKAPVLRKRSSSPANKIKQAFKRRSTEPRSLISDSASDKSGESDGRLNSSHGFGNRRESADSEDEEDDNDERNSTLELPVLSEKSSEERSELLLTPHAQSSPALVEHATQGPGPYGVSNGDIVPSTPPEKAIAPATLVTPPTPTSARAATLAKDDSVEETGSPITSQQGNPNIVISPSGNQISHKRARSSTNPKSSLSKQPPSLTPMVEEAKTPGGSLVHPNNAGGFFSSMFSAAQHAANQFSNSINSSSIGQGQKGKAALGVPEPEKIEDIPEEATNGTSDVENNTENEISKKRQLAVETLGSGNLSLSHLGIDENTDSNPLASAAEIPDKSVSTIRKDEAAASVEDQQAARAISAAYEKPPVVADDASVISEPLIKRPLSISRVDGDATPPRPPSMEPDGVGILRSGSVRSKISGRRRRRHRGSSATTSQTTIGAGLMGMTNALANPGVSMNGRTPTGFAVASSKRNREFHHLFRSVPEDDYLIEDYSAALQRDILLHGRLYVSEGHICFSSNILGWVTNLVISFDEVVSVEKKNTAVIFPNAIVIQTLHARNVFASFVARDSTYDLLIGIWKISHPNLKSSVNGVTLDDSGTGDKTEKAESVATEDASLDGSEDEVYDEDAEEDDEVASSLNDRREASIEESELGDAIRTLSRKTSAPAVATTSGPPGGQTTSSKQAEAMDPVTTGAAVSADYPGSPMHEPTTCGDTDTHYDKLLIDTTVPAPLGKIYSLMFGPGSSVFMKKWLVDDQRNWDLNWIDSAPGGMNLENKTFGYSYMKPLNASIGPKQTKCVLNNTLTAFDLEKAVSIDCSTQNPDVPSGNAFVVKTRYCLMWGPENSTRIVMNFTIEWTGKSWLKAPIEKGAIEGQTQYAKDIVSALRAAVVTKPPVRGPPRAGTKSGKPSSSSSKRKKNEADGDSIPEPGAQAAEAIVQQKKKAGANWGPLEPLRAVLEPVGQVLGSAVSAPVLVALGVLLLGWWWVARGRVGGAGGVRGAAGVGFAGQMGAAERAVAYEEIWRREESALWDWLEERVGLEDGGLRGMAGGGKQHAGRGMGKSLQDERMSERQMDEAIRVTEAKLKELKEAVGRKREGGVEKDGKEGENRDGRDAILL